MRYSELQKQKDKETVRKFLEKGIPLTADIVRRWLNGAGLPYSWLAAELKCSESTVKNWLSTTESIPKKREPEIRQIINRRTLSEMVYRDTGDSTLVQTSVDEISADYRESRIIVPEDKDEDVTYVMPRYLYSQLAYIGKKRLKTVQHLINEVLYSWLANIDALDEKKRVRLKKQFRAGPIERFQIEKITKGIENIEAKLESLRAMQSGIEEPFAEVMALAASTNDSPLASSVKATKEMLERTILSYEAQQNNLKTYLQIAEEFNKIYSQHPLESLEEEEKDAHKKNF